MRTWDYWLQQQHCCSWRFRGNTWWYFVICTCTPVLCDTYRMEIKGAQNEIHMCLFHACQKHSSLLNRDIVLQNTANNICFKIWSIPSRSYGKHIPWFCPFQIMYLLKAFSNSDCCRSRKISGIKLHYGLSSSRSHDFFERHHLFAVLIYEAAKESATWKMKLIDNSSIMSDKQFAHKLKKQCPLIGWWRFWVIWRILVWQWECTYVLTAGYNSFERKNLGAATVVCSCWIIWWTWVQQ